MNARTAPVSSAQARLWLLDRMFPGEPLYNELFALRIEGALDATVLARALNDIVRRHDSLHALPVEAARRCSASPRRSEIALPLDDLTAIADDRRRCSRWSPRRRAHAVRPQRGPPARTAAPRVPRALACRRGPPHRHRRLVVGRDAA
jgi:hypothetical protein